MKQKSMARDAIDITSEQPAVAPIQSAAGVPLCHTATWKGSCHHYDIDMAIGQMTIIQHSL
jgi:hypothetical protein